MIDDSRRTHRRSGRFAVAYGVVRDADPAIRVLTGFSGEEIQGSNGAVFVHPQDRPRYIAALQQAVSEGTSAAEVRMIDMAGRATACSLCIKQRDDREVEVLLEWTEPPHSRTQHDLSANASATSAELPASPPAEAAELLEDSATDYLEIDAQGRLVRVETAGNVPWHAWRPGDDLRELGSRLSISSRSAIERAARKRQRTVAAFYDHELERAFTLYALPVAPDHLGLFIRDVSLDESRRAAAAEEARYSDFVTKLIDAAKDALVSITLDGRITFWNAAAERIFGFTRAEAVNIRLIDLLRPQAVTFPDMGTLIQNGQWEGEIEMLTRDGRSIIVCAHAQVMTNEAGTPEQIAVLYSDVTARRRDAHRDRAQARIADLALLASGVTHDLNSVFTPIVLGIQLLQQQVADRSTLALLQTVGSSAARGLQMITRVLAVARGEHSDRQQLAVTDLLQQLAEYGAVRLPDRIRLTIEQDDDVAVLADQDQLLQVLVNLVDNAAEVIQGTGRITVRQCVDTVEGHVRITVEDNGPGMDEITLGQIFQPFFTTKAASWGTGLGLAASRSIAEQHGGTLTASSNPGVGTAFALDLPVSGRLDRRSEAPANSENSEADGRGRVVLVAEPDPDALHTIRSALEAARFRVLAAADVETAVSWIEGGPRPDMIVIDVALEPGLRRLLQDSTPHLPALLTGPAPLQRPEGADSILLPKPFNRVALLRAVTALTAERTDT